MTITSGGEQGTAFLIDADQGWFLTARHVVEPSIRDSSKPVRGRFDARADILSLSVVAHDERLDVALLQAADTEQVSNRNELELSFVLPERQSVMVVGAASGTIETPDVVALGPTDFAVQHDGLISVPGSVKRGDSGGPVVKVSDGLVIGIVIQRNARAGLATPTSSLSNLLLPHATSPDTLAEFGGGRTVPDRHRLAEVFRADRSKMYSNVELVALIAGLRSVWDSTRTPLFPRVIGGCSTYTVAASRHLGAFAADADLLSKDFSHGVTIRHDGMSDADIKLREEWIEKAFDEGNYQSVIKLANEVRGSGGELPLQALYYLGKTYEKREQFSEASRVLELYHAEAHRTNRDHSGNDYSSGLGSEISDLLWEMKKKIDADNDAFKKANDVRTWASYRSYLTDYPTGIHAEDVRRLQAVAADRETYQYLHSLGSAVGYEMYLTAFPSGAFTNEAERLFERAIEQEAYDHVKLPGRALLYDSFLKVFPSAASTEEVTRLYEEAKEREVYGHLDTIGTAVAYQLYLRNYPRGIYSERANNLRTQALKRKAHEYLDQIRENPVYEALVRVFPEDTEVAQQLAQDSAGHTASFGDASVPDQRFRKGAAIEVLSFPEAVASEGSLSYRLTPEIPGLTFDPATRQLRGTPMDLGYYVMSYTVQATDRGHGAEDSDSIEFVVFVGGTDCDRCPDMVVVPPGTYAMGSPDGEEGRQADEGPQHRVTIDAPFAVGKFEVTRAEWNDCVEYSKDSPNGGCREYEIHPGWRLNRRPAVGISWHDAQAYARWLSLLTNKTYRLLSESEWEYVARGGTTTSRYWGDLTSDQCAYANGADFSAKRYSTDPNVAECDDGFVGPTIVGSFKENAFGLYDVLGNVREWTQDCWNPSYRGAPTDGSDWDGGDCSRRVVRGGSSGSRPDTVRSAFRDSLDSDRGYDYVGLRVARALESRVE